MWAVNFCFARLTFAPFYQRYRPTALVRDEFADLAPPVLGMLVVGVAQPPCSSARSASSRWRRWRW